MSLSFCPSWPLTNRSVDPVEWRLVMGRFDEVRWRTEWTSLFSTHTLVHNRRRTVNIEVSDEGDGALAVVDIDTLWRKQSTCSLLTAGK
jgi:hypothetical protein